MKHRILLPALLAGAVLAGCGPRESEHLTGEVSGTLVYRERMMLSPEAVARVTLEDVTIADAPAKIVAEAEMKAPGQVPIAFTLEFDPHVILVDYGGNALTPCMHDADGNVVTGDAYKAKIDTDSRHAVWLAQGLGAKVLLIDQPAGRGDALSGTGRVFLAIATENADGTTTLTYREPSSVFAPYDNAEIDAMAKELDAIFARIAADASS